MCPLFSLYPDFGHHGLRCTGLETVRLSTLAFSLLYDEQPSPPKGRHISVPFLMLIYIGRASRHFRDVERYGQIVSRKRDYGSQTLLTLGEPYALVQRMDFWPS